jgi:hypothetical protein
MKRFPFSAHYLGVRRNEMSRKVSTNLDRDAAWIMTLWRALHGENAAPGDIAADVIANLAQFVPASDQSFGMQPLPSPPCIIACPPESSETDADATDAQSDPVEVAPMFELECHDPDDFSVHHRYFKFNGVFYCLERPAIACLPTAA